MGYIANHAIVVEGYGESDRLADAHAKAREIFGERVSEIVYGGVNGSAAFFVPPDGSKEGWSASDEGDEKREAFTTYLRSTYLDWVEVRFGGDDPDLARVEHHDGEYVDA